MMVHIFFQAISGNPNKANFFASRKHKKLKFSHVFSVLFSESGNNGNSKLSTWLDLIAENFSFDVVI